MLSVQLEAPVWYTAGLSLSLQVLRLLCAIHRAGLRHRDIRPENLMLYKDRVMVIDWLFAVSGGDSEVEYRGASHFVTDGLATLIADATATKRPFSYVFTKLDDLEWWLRVCIAMSNPAVRNFLRRVVGQADSVQSVVRMWQAVLTRSPLWASLRAKMTELASVADEHVDYAALESMLPVPCGFSMADHAASTRRRRV